MTLILATNTPKKLSQDKRENGAFNARYNTSEGMNASGEISSVYVCISWTGKFTRCGSIPDRNLRLSEWILIEGETEDNIKFFRRYTSSGGFTNKFK